MKVKSTSVNINLLSSSRRCQNAKWKFWNPLSFDSQKLFNGVLMTTMINDTLITLTYPNINVTSVLEFSEQKSTGSIFVFVFSWHKMKVFWSFWVWQYGLWSFQTGVVKLERFLHKNQPTQRKLLNFENWTNGEPQ